MAAIPASSDDIPLRNLSQPAAENVAACNSASAIFDSDGDASSTVSTDDHSPNEISGQEHESTSADANLVPTPNTASTKWLTWQHAKPLLILCYRLAIVLIGLAAAWMTLSLASWTAAKDWNEHCRDLMDKSGVVSPICADAANKTLGPPPSWLGSWLGKPTISRFRRELSGTTASKNTVSSLISSDLSVLTAKQYFPVLLVFAVSLTFAIAMIIHLWSECKRFLKSCQPAFLHMQRSKDGLQPTELLEMKRVTDPAAGLPSLWVPNSIPRRELNFSFTSGLNLGLTTGLTQRSREVFGTTLELPTSSSATEDSDEDWVPAGVSCITESGDASETDSASQPSAITSDLDYLTKVGMYRGGYERGYKRRHKRSSLRLRSAPFPLD